MASTTPVYADRIVAFIDILGFTALVRRLGAEPSLHAKIQDALIRIKSCGNSVGITDTPLSDLEVSAFSDSIVISGRPKCIRAIIWSAIHLQCDLLKLGIPIRGGIACGQTLHGNGIIYGEGVLDAHHLESSAAVYPRIVISPILADGLEARYRAAFFRQDTDKLWFIDPFAMGILYGGAEDLAAEGYDPYEESLKVLGRKIDDELSRLSDVGHLAKWNWLKRQLDIAIQEIKENKAPRFEQYLSECRKGKRSVANAKIRTNHDSD